MMIFESVLKWRNVSQKTLLAEQTLSQICMGTNTLKCIVSSIRICFQTVKRYNILIRFFHMSID